MCVTINVGSGYVASYKGAFEVGILKIVLIRLQPEMLRQGVPQLREIQYDDSH